MPTWSPRCACSYSSGQRLRRREGPRDAVGTGKLQAKSISGAKLAVGAVTSSNIAEGTITGQNIK